MGSIAPAYDDRPAARRHTRHPGKTPRRRLIVSALIGIALALPASGTLADHVFFDEVTAAAEEAQGWPDFDPSDMSQEVAITEAGLEAATWPDFDPSDMSAEVAVTKAKQEAATWPDLDPSDMSQEVAATKAKEEAAGGPDFDSTAIDSQDDVEVVVGRGLPH